MSVELKIKSKHLSVEAQIIRFEEQKLRKQINWLKEHQKPFTSLDEKWDSLNAHRRIDVRQENRATFLARAYIEGKAYLNVEQKRKPEKEYDFSRVMKRVAAMVAKYGKDTNITYETVKNYEGSYRRKPTVASMQLLEDKLNQWVNNGSNEFTTR